MRSISLGKHLLIIFFIFSMLEKTGISMLKLVTGTKPLSEYLAGEESSEAAAKSETKDTVKEYWLMHQAYSLPEPDLHCHLLVYSCTDSNNHLGYFPPVPTPPPDYIV